MNDASVFDDVADRMLVTAELVDQMLPSVHSHVTDTIRNR